MKSIEKFQDCSFKIFYSRADDSLNSFYIPALKVSVRYDRSAGFFSSTALAVAAEGVAHLIQNGGRMRLLVGADLSEEDVSAIRSGYDLREKITEKMLQRFPDPEDALLRRRLEVMAWMVAERQLEIRVVLPKDKDGMPISAEHCRDYYHPKSGVMTDAAGSQVAFSGSVNESETAWLNNYETFTVYFSWNDTKPYLAQIKRNFEKLWDGNEPDWIAIEIPEAVKQRLLKYRPEAAPKKDPMEDDPVLSASQEIEIQKERILFQFLRDAPHLMQASGLGAATAALTPWPHQIRVADAVIRRFPERAMLCDEVGLGKTIEAGLIIRQLVLSGVVKRCLILAPRSVLRQWQEELYEKFTLSVPLFDGTNYWDLKKDKPIEATPGNPWEAYPILLAGSQLAKRADRRAEILRARGWDLLVVDEAHHARRKDFKDNFYRQNRLLSLIDELSRQQKISSLLLMTATPMQVHPLEVWDLLKLLGLGGRWGADEENFLQYFKELCKPIEQVDWNFLLDMIADELMSGGKLDDNFARQVEREVGPVKWSMIRELPAQKAQRAFTLSSLGKDAYPYLSTMASRHTPLQRFVFRNTRSLLREYKKKGILQANVPVRNPALVRVKMSSDEYSLYERIQEYISHFYQKYENERRGLGFIMTVYRRRLTSSFFAVQCSLERRLKFLRGEINPDTAYGDDDLEQEDLSLDYSDEVESDTRDRFQAEIQYLENFIHDLQILSVADSKLERLKGDLQQIFLDRDTVLVFTQYTDTMDYLRSQLVEVYGTKLACYSGRGGEIWNGIAWVQTTKEAVKNEFKEGHIQIMLCTESASEGLNLQTCGVLINYDMPWNPMRVEQRIGRIDRIGQVFEEVWIKNYFYRDTIEDLIYQRLADRINWFEVVVGELQPILNEIGEVTRRLAMLPGTISKKEIDKEITALKQRLQNLEVESLNLDEFSRSEENYQSQVSPLRMINLEKIFTESRSTSRYFQKHPVIEGAYYLHLNDHKEVVTFSPECFDEHPDTVQFLTYGSLALDVILGNVARPEKLEAFHVTRCETDNPVPMCGWYVQNAQEQIQLIQTLDELAQLLNKSQDQENFSEAFLERVNQSFQASVEEIQNQKDQILQQRRYGEYLAERAKAQRILIKAALVELALRQYPESFEQTVYPSAFTEHAVSGLRRHGFPWSALLQLANKEQELIPQEDDPYFQKNKDASKESLIRTFSGLVEEAKKSVKNLSELK